MLAPDCQTEEAFQQALIRPEPPTLLARVKQLRAAFNLRLRSGRASIANDIDKELALSARFHFSPIFLGSGAVIYFAWPVEPQWVYLLASLAVLVALRLVINRKPKIVPLLNVLLLLALGGNAAKWETMRHEHNVLGGELSTTLTGSVRAAEKTDRGSRVWLEVLSTSEPQLKHAPQAVRVNFPKSAALPGSGDMIVARMRLQPSGGPLRLHGYDFAFYSWFDDVGAIGFATGQIAHTDARSSELSLFQRLERLRAVVAERVRSVIGGEEGNVAAALITGVQAGISNETAEAMRISGLAHVLSISGLHMALAAAIFMYGIRGLFALVPEVAARLPVKKIAATLALLSCSFYLALSGAAVATTRSWIMIAVMLIAILLDRPALTLRNLAISALLILLVTPHEVMGPSFQLSFAATAALVSAYAAYARWHSVRPHKMPAATIVGRAMHFGAAALRGATLTSVVAGLATALFSVWHFNRLAPLGLPANLAAMIPVSVIIMPFAVLSMILMPFGMDTLPLKVMGWGVRAMNEIAIMFADMSPDMSASSMPKSSFLLGAAALILVVLLQTKLRFLAIVPAVTAIATMSFNEKPDILVSEDGKLVAVRTASGTYAANLRQPGRFISDVWKQTLGVSEFARPIPITALAKSEVFSCDQDYCKITRGDGLRIIWQDYPKLKDEVTNFIGKREDGKQLADAVGLIENAMMKDFRTRTQSLCSQSDVLIINGPAGRNPCGSKPSGGSGPIIIDAYSLARKGAAELRLTKTDNKPTKTRLEDENTRSDVEKTSQTNGTLWSAHIKFAVGEPSRPWNRERIYSRAARNLPPFRPIRQELNEASRTAGYPAESGTSQ